MATPFAVAVGLSIILAAVHFFGEEINEKYPAKGPITSFSAGITVSYIFLQLLPELTTSTQRFGNYTFLFALAGFATVHIAEKYIYHHDRDINELKHDFKLLHTVFLFLYHLGIGIILYFLLQTDLVHGILFFVPVLFHTAISSLSLKELHEDILDSTPVRLLVSISAPVGSFLAHLLSPTVTQFHIVIGLIAGMFLYIATSDSLTPESKGEPWSFLAGVLLYTAIILITWSIV